MTEKVRANVGHHGYFLFCCFLFWCAHGLFFMYLRNKVKLKLTKYAKNDFFLEFLEHLLYY